MRIRVLVSLPLVWGIASAQSLPAMPLPEVEYASPDQSVWTTRTDAQGQPDNPLLAVAGQLFARAGMPWHAHAYPAARLFKRLADGSSQFSMLVNAPALKECCLLSRRPITIAEIRVYHFAGKPPIRTKEDLVGKGVISVHGYSYGGLQQFFTDQRNRVANSVALTHAAAFKMLARGRADYLVDYAGPASEVLAEEPLADLRSELLSRQEVFLVLSRAYPNAQRVMDRLEGIARTLDVDRLFKDSRRMPSP